MTSQAGTKEENSMIPEWEKEFDVQIPMIVSVSDRPGSFVILRSDHEDKKIKNFIRKLLSQESKRVREEEREKITTWIKEEQKEIEEHSGMIDTAKYAALIRLYDVLEFIKSLSKEEAHEQ